MSDEQPPSQACKKQPLDSAAARDRLAFIFRKLTWNGKDSDGLCDEALQLLQRYPEHLAVDFPIGDMAII